MTKFHFDAPLCEAIAYMPPQRQRNLLYIHARRYARNHGLIGCEAELPVGSEVCGLPRPYTMRIEVQMPDEEEARFDRLLQSAGVELAPL